MGFKYVKANKDTIVDQGDRVRFEKKTYIVCRVGREHYVLCSLRNGNRWSDSYARSEKGVLKLWDLTEGFQTGFQTGWEVRKYEPARSLKF